MKESLFSSEDVKQIRERGMTVEKVISQLEIFKKGFPYAKLKRPCTVGDGITVLRKGEILGFGEIFSKTAAPAGKAMKFVPASGAASRMFKVLLSFNNRYERVEEREIRAEAHRNDPEHVAFLKFIEGLRKFAFWNDLKSVMSRDGLDVEAQIDKGHYKDILQYVLTAKGLNLAHLPKGLIKFHLYPGASRTPFEEHLEEAAAYTMDKNRRARIHFTVSPEHEGQVKDHLREALSRYEKLGIKYELTFSTQKNASDTIAVDMENRPFRDRHGRLLFRPGGHGALLENLNDLKGDTVFIKNIDNVVPDRLKQETYFYKKALGGYLTALQKRIFGYLQRLSARDLDGALINEAFEFMRDKLFITPPDGTLECTRVEKIGYLVSKLNRPLRVCGMVKKEREPGGGPFWVEHGDGSTSLQIVESSQVEMKSAEQKNIWESSTHFNPVDLVCGVRDHMGRPFHLKNFVDPETGFISMKSQDGKELKALELPGLWNGAMAHWNTVFVEVPIITFNPVKTVLDLLRKEHQP